MKEFFFKYFPWMLLGLTVFLLIREIVKEPETKTITVTRFIEVPEKKGDPDPIFLPAPLPNPVRKQSIDSTWYNKYVQLKDSVEKQKLFEKAITVNEYYETWEDNDLELEMWAKVRGELLSLDPKYKIKGFKLPDTLDVKVPVQEDLFDLITYVEVGSGQFFMTNPSETGAIVKSGVDLRINRIIVGTSYDTRNMLWFKIGYKWF